MPHKTRLRAATVRSLSSMATKMTKTPPARLRRAHRATLKDTWLEPKWLRTNRPRPAMPDYRVLSGYRSSATRALERGASPLFFWFQENSSSHGSPKTQACIGSFPGEPVIIVFPCSGQNTRPTSPTFLVKMARKTLRRHVTFDSSSPQAVPSSNFKQRCANMHTYVRTTE